MGRLGGDGEGRDTGYGLTSLEREWYSRGLRPDSLPVDPGWGSGDVRHPWSPTYTTGPGTFSVRPFTVVGVTGSGFHTLPD